MQLRYFLYVVVCLTGSNTHGAPVSSKGETPLLAHGLVLNPESFRHHVDFFNDMEPENIVNYVPNRESWEWLRDNVPFFECPDKHFEQIYYFRWWTFRKHLKKTADGFVFTEFLDRMSHSGKHNTISCALGHHVYEGSWLRDKRYIDEYARFWYVGHDGGLQPHFHRYSNWGTWSLYRRYLVNQDQAFLTALLDAFIADYQAWQQLLDPQGFKAPMGIMTAERRHPQFRSHGVGTCEWDGAVWPYATSQTLVALANVLRNYRQQYVNRADYFDALLTYARCHRYQGRPYIGEYLDEREGTWLTPDSNQSRYYNHSTFCELVIGGLVGLVPRDDNVVVVDPLLPDHVWDWFCLDSVFYHGRTLTILWDRTGEKYHKGSGLRVLANGVEIARSEGLARVSGRLPPSTIVTGSNESAM